MLAGSYDWAKSTKLTRNFNTFMSSRCRRSRH